MKKQFGKYKLLDKIATGGMAEIWLARQRGVKGFEKLVVLKKILPEFTSNKEFVDMFLNEARVAAMLTHPNIVQIYDLGKVRNIYYIAMEYIFGLSLDKLLIQSVKKRNPLPLQFACNIISQAATGLHYAHNMRDIYGTPMNIVHRDISPQNILVSYEGVAKVVDFGIAKANTVSSQKTQAGKIKGKVAYMPPEQIKGQKLDGRADIFALGVVLYEITTGKRLFPNVTNPFEIMNLMLSKDFIPPHVLNPKYPVILSKIIMKAMHKDKNRRYQSALAFGKDLEKFLKISNSPVFSSDISLWLKKVFEYEIKQIKDKHENLLREDDDLLYDEEETTSLLRKQPKIEPLNYGFDDDDDDETVISNSASVAAFREEFKNSEKVETWDEDEDGETVMAKPGFHNFNNREDFSKRVDYIKNNGFDEFENDDFFDFPEETAKSNESTKKNSDAQISRRRKNRGVKRIEPIKKKDNHRKRIYTKEKIKSEKKEKKKEKGSFSLIKKLVLILFLYFLYFGVTIGLKYISAEQRFTDIIENAYVQPDKELSIKDSVNFFCRNNEDVKCVKNTFLIKKEDTLGVLGFDIEYEIENYLFWEFIKYFPESLRKKIPIKINIKVKKRFTDLK